MGKGLDTKQANKSRIKSTEAVKYRGYVPRKFNRYRPHCGKKECSRNLWLLARSSPRLPLLNRIDIPALV